MAEQPPSWLAETDQQETSYLTTRITARPWESAPLSPVHRYLLLGAIAGALLLLAVVAWSVHGQIRLG